MNNRPPFCYTSSPNRFGILHSKLLGRGSNSEVFEGINLVTGQHVSIKRVNILTNTQYKIAVNEVNALRTIKHKNVLRYIHHYFQGPYLFLVTELCEENLFAKLLRQGKMEQNQACKFFLDILQGYQTLRKQGYLHRDFKPENILLKDNSPKIADLGFSIRITSENIKESFNIGSPLYMAPQVLQQNIYSEKSDLWGLILVFYEMLHRQNPFKSKNEKQLMKQIKIPLKSFDISAALASLIKNGLSVSPLQRFSLSKLKAQLISHIHSKRTIDITPSRSKQDLNRAYTNEINFLRFMEYLQILSQKITNQTIKSRAFYLLQSTIRKRISFIDEFLKSTTCLPLHSSSQLSELKQKHRFHLNLPQNLTPHDRLHFFSSDKSMDECLYVWQLQAQLKDIIKEVFKELTYIDSQFKIGRIQSELRFIDYTMTFYVMNRMLIDCNNNPYVFSHNSQLLHILGRPNRFNLKTWHQMKEKGKELSLI